VASIVLAAPLLAMNGVSGCDGEASDVRGPNGDASGGAGGVTEASGGKNGTPGGAAGTIAAAGGGAAGSGGASIGDASDDDASDDHAPIDAPPQSSECLAQAIAEYRVRLEGTGFNAYEGLTLHFLTEIALGAGGGSCQARTLTTIVGGAFAFEITNLTDGAVYPRLVAFIDIDDDGACRDGADLTWLSTGSVALGSLLTRTLTPNAFSAADAGTACAFF
jgi:hypothetical protein